MKNISFPPKRSAAESYRSMNERDEEDREREEREEPDRAVEAFNHSV
jgi:hypothetical protein